VGSTGFFAFLGLCSRLLGIPKPVQQRQALAGRRRETNGRIQSTITGQAGKTIHITAISQIRRRRTKLFIFGCKKGAMIEMLDETTCLMVIYIKYQQMAIHIPSARTM
jgi:hypothetical protein